jgi:hypothetical protein
VAISTARTVFNSFFRNVNAVRFDVGKNIDYVFLSCNTMLSCRWLQHFSEILSHRSSTMEIMVYAELISYEGKGDAVVFLVNY